MPCRIRIVPKEVLTLLLLSLGVTVLVVVAMVVLGEYTKTRGRLLFTALAFAGYCLLALAPSQLAQRPKYSVVGAAGLGVATAGYLLVVGGAWGTPNSDGYWKATGLVTIGAASLSYLARLLMLETLAQPVRLARLVGLGATTMTPLLAGIGILAEVKTASFWWGLALVVMFQLGAGFVAWVLSWRFLPRLLPFTLRGIRRRSTAWCDPTCGEDS